MLNVLAPCIAASLSTPPPITQTIDGITCAIGGIETRTLVSWDWDGNDMSRPTVASRGRYLEVRARAVAKADGPLFVEGAFDITEALDEHGVNWLASTTPARRESRLDRQSLRGRFASQAQDTRGTSSAIHLRESMKGAGALPAMFSHVRAKVEVILAGTTARRPIDKGLLNEAVEVTPGVSFLLTRFDEQEHQQHIDFEVHIKRPAEIAKGAYEPIFAGLVLREAGGGVLQLLQAGQEFETRDEYIVVSKGAAFTSDWFAHVKTIEALVFADIHTARFELDATDIPVAADPGPSEHVPPKP